MQNRERNLLRTNRARRVGVLAALSLACLAGGVSGQSILLDDEQPLIVGDEETVTSPAATPVPPVPVAPAPPAGGAPPSPPPVSADGVVRQDGLSGGPLLDPTRSKEEVRSAQIPGSGMTANPLLPNAADGGMVRPPLTIPDGSSAFNPPLTKPPVTATTPFAPEQNAGPGPVVLGTDLNPAGIPTALAPDQATPDFLDEPLVESTDPWVFSVEVAGLFDDNIRLSGVNKEQDFLFMLRASVAWQWGDVTRKRASWGRIFYEATGIAFAEDSDENSVDHDFQAGGQLSRGRLSAALEARYRKLSGATPDLGDRVDRDEYGVKLGATYELTGKTFLEANTGWNAVNYREAALADYDEWVAEVFAGYELSGRTKVAAGGAVGRLDVDRVGQQDFQRALLKVTRASTGALGLTGKAGAEFRQTNRGNTVSPVFSVTADWEPVEDGTKVSLQVFRETVASGALAGENYLRTGAVVRLMQRLGSRFAAGLEAGYEKLEYEATQTATSSNRSDDYFYARPGLKYEFDARRRAEVFYTFRQDESSLDDYSFTGNQWGLSFGLDF